jgi:1,4-alpha-glucan branching enzyme
MCDKRVHHAGEEPMSIKKQSLKSKPICKVTFKVTPEIVGDADTVHLVGDFNGWEKAATPMKKLKNGCFTVTVDLEKEKDYQFRYLVDEKEWVNDPEADRFEASPYPGIDNPVVSV